MVSTADWTERTAPSRAITVDRRGDTITDRAGSRRRRLCRRIAATADTTNAIRARGAITAQIVPGLEAGQPQVTLRGR
jgi:hypothetical protein